MKKKPVIVMVGKPPVRVQITERQGFLITKALKPKKQ